MTRESTPFFSVVTPSFNQGPYLEGCIQSVLEQGDPDFEHLLFDNCSTDETGDVVARHPHVKAVFERDSGQSEAVNKGFRAARGEIICWLNSDDRLAPGAFKLLREAFADPACGAVFGNIRMIHFDGKPDSVHAARFDDRQDFLRWWRWKVKLHQPAVFFRRALAEQTGMLREDLHMALDYEYWWRMSAHSKFHYLDAVLAVQLRQPDSKTIRDRITIYHERAAIFEPILRQTAPESCWSLFIEKHRALGWRYLDLAEDCRLTAGPVSLRLLWEALSTNPFLIVSPRLWQIVVRPLLPR